MSTSHTFIPLNNISAVIINEGLSRWNVRYYLAVVIRRGGGVVVALDVGGYFLAPDTHSLTGTGHETATCGPFGDLPRCTGTALQRI
jgi:hypothetical protein